MRDSPPLRSRRLRLVTPRRRRALQLIADAGGVREGVSQDILHTRGCGAMVLNALIKAGMVRVSDIRIRAGRRRSRVAHLRITAKGLMALVAARDREAQKSKRT